MIIQMQSPLISIIIPAYNHEMFVADAINSVLKQSLADFEIIVIDDGSTDNTLAEIKKIDDPRIRLFHQKNIGAAKTINRGIDLSHGQYITILNSDDMYHPERLALFKRYMDINPDTMVLSSLVQPVDTLGNPLRPGSGNAFHDYWLKWYGAAVQNLLQDDNYFFTLLQSNFVVSTSNIFLNSRIFQNEDKFPILFYCHDYAFLLRALQSYPFGFIHKHLMQYRLHETNTIRHNHFLKHLEVQYAVFHALNFDEILSSSNLQNKMSSIVFRGLEKNPDININHGIQLAAEKDVLLQEADRKINYLEKVVAEKESYLAEKDHFLQEILDSRSWRLLTWYRDMKQSLFAKSKTPQTPPEPPAQFDENTYYAKVLHPINPKRTKVIHAIANFHTGGSSRLVVDLIEHLGHKYDQEVISFLIPTPIAYAGVKMHDFSKDVTEDQIVSFLKKKNAQILHVHYWGEGDAAWYHKVFHAAEKWQGILIENVNTPVVPFISDRVNHYVYVSAYAKNFATCEAEKSSVIYPGSNLTLFDRHNALIPDNVIGMVYRLDSDKLKEDAIRVFIEVVKKRPRTRVLIVGGGEFLIAYQKQVAQEEGATANFEFTGYVPYGKLPEYYQQMSIFVAPVWKESFGQVSPFAMSMKIPVVGYRIGALSEILGSNELLATNSDDLSDIIVKLLEDREKRIEIGYNNYLRVHERFSVEAMVTAYNRLYDRLIHEHEIDGAL